MNRESASYLDDLKKLTLHARTYLGDIKNFKAEVGSNSFNYLRVGKGEVILLLHGFNGTPHGWRLFMQAFKDDYCLIAPTLPGLDYQSNLKDLSNFSMRNLSRMIDEFMEQLGIDRFHLASHSAGSTLAASYALQHPDKVASLALVSMPKLFSDPSSSEKELEEMAEFLLPTTKEGIDEMNDYLFRHVPNVPKRFLERFAANIQLNREQRLGVIREILKQTSMLVPRFSQLKAPVILVYGNNDNAIPESTIEYLMAKVPNIQSYCLGEAGHVPLVESPEELSKIYRSFQTFIRKHPLSSDKDQAHLGYR